MGVGEHLGYGPDMDRAHNEPMAAAREMARCVKLAPAQLLRSCVLPGNAEADQLEPTDPVARQTDYEQPPCVGGEVGEVHRSENGVLHSFNVVLNFYVGAQPSVGFATVTILIGPKSSVLFVERGNEVALGLRVQRLAQNAETRLFMHSSIFND
jgi:hypothetical protein